MGGTGVATSVRSGVLCGPETQGKSVDAAAVPVVLGGVVGSINAAHQLF